MLTIIGSEGIQSIGSGTICPISTGTVPFRIQDDKGTIHFFKIDDVLHVPNNPISLPCPQQWAALRKHQLGDHAAHCNTRDTHFLMEWNLPEGKAPYKYILLKSSNVGVTYTAPNFLYFQSCVV